MNIEYFTDADVSKLANALKGSADALKHYGVLQPASEFRFIEPYLRWENRLNGRSWWSRFWWQGVVQICFPGLHTQLIADLDIYKRAYQAEVLERLAIINVRPHG